MLKMCVFVIKKKKSYFKCQKKQYFCIVLINKMLGKILHLFNLKPTWNTEITHFVINHNNFTRTHLKCKQISRKLCTTLKHSLSVTFLIADSEITSNFKRISCTVRNLNTVKYRNLHWNLDIISVKVRLVVFIWQLLITLDEKNARA